MARVRRGWADRPALAEGPPAVAISLDQVGRPEIWNERFPRQPVADRNSTAPDPLFTSPLNRPSKDM